MAQKYLGFPIHEALENRVFEVISDIKNNNNKRQFALKLFQAISDLSDIGFDFFFVESLKRAGLGKIKMMAVENAITVGKKAILTLGKGIIKSMDDEQLLTVATILEESMFAKNDIV